MRRRISAALLSALLLLAGCAPAAVGGGTQRRFEATFLELFDTVTTVVGYADSEEQFRAEVDRLRAGLEEYHRLYDIYHSYEGLSNIKTINDNAGVAPVEVDGRIIDLLELCRDLCEETGGKVNAAMGSVLALWHDARQAGVNDPANAALPDREALEEAMRHSSFDAVVIDRDASTVYLPDPRQRLDVGAVAKGYAVEQVCRELSIPAAVSVGGNVCVTGPKPDGSAWSIGVQDPDGGGYIRTLSVSGGCVVSSGDYQRYYTVEGVRYHHIIDPDTLYPADAGYRAVSVLCPDSGLADGLSTALFCMDIETGSALLRAHGAEAMWVLEDGSPVCSPGFEQAVQP